jgi:histidine ammonia-lyase
MPVRITGNDLTLSEVTRVARAYEPVELARESAERMAAACGIAARALERGEAVYGLTTGVGAHRHDEVKSIGADRFNRSLLSNHRIGQGADAPEDVVRAAMLRLVNGFAKGNSPVRPEIAQLFVAALNQRAHPRVRMLGSVGQSDLAQMADLTIGVLGHTTPAPGEGLALLNNNAFSTGLAALAVADCARLLDAMDLAGALDLEAFAANLSILHPAVGDTRPYPGLQSTLLRLREVLDGSYLWAANAARNLQDPLTFRCICQVHGAARDAYSYVHRTLSIELNAYQGNPLLVPDEGRIVSVANFDILPLAAALDFLRIAIAPALTSANERVVKLLDADLTGLPQGLAVRSGLSEDSLDELGVASQALTAEARLLAQPVSYELSSSSHAGGIEDRITMAPLAARRLAEMVDLAERVVAIELVVATQAVDLRAPDRLGRGTQQLRELVRRRVGFKGEGDMLPEDLEPVRQLVRSGELSNLGDQVAP